MPKEIFNHYSDVTAAITRLPADRVALGLDFDGTLAHFNNDPDAVRIPDQTHKDIRTLSQILNGAVAIITGRDADFIERVIFKDSPLPASYGHGAFVRKSPAHELERSAIEINEAAIDKLLAEVVLPQGVTIEIKPQARAIHWRESDLPDEVIEPVVRAIVDDVVARYNDKYTEGAFDYSPVKAEGGRKVLEIGSSNASKGHAIDLFSDVPEFRGRSFVYFGDQPADESAMKRVNELGGINIGVGKDAPAIAQLRLQSPDDVHKVLNALANNAKWAEKRALKLDL